MKTADSLEAGAGKSGRMTGSRTGAILRVRSGAQGLNRDDLGFELDFDARERLGLLPGQPRHLPEIHQLMRRPDPSSMDSLGDESLPLTITRCEPQSLWKTRDPDLDWKSLALELVRGHWEDRVFYRERSEQISLAGRQSLSKFCRKRHLGGKAPVRT